MALGTDHVLVTRHKKISKKNRLRMGHFFTAPYILFNAVFWGFPFVWSFVISFQSYNLLSPTAPWVGFGNFISVFKSNAIRYVSWNTLVFLAVFIPLSLGCAIVLAICIQKVNHFRGLFTAIFLLPSVSPQVGYSLIFKYMFAGDGQVNAFTSAIGLPTIPWFTDPQIAMISIAIVVTWRMTGYFALFFIASMKSIPQQLYEAAELDGAGPWVSFWRITWPMLNASLVITLVLSVVTAFSLFAEPFLLTNGGPLNSTMSFVMVLYQRAFNFLQLGFGSAWAVVTAAISLTIVLGIRRLVERPSHWG
ncbi:MAG: carbohydrate ABC transporter permease [Bacilli bacterium]